MRVSYLDHPAVGITVNLVRSWDRGEITAQTMSASSGPKDYVRNRIWQIFEDHKNVVRVLMVRGEFSQIGSDKHPSPPFLLVADAAGKTFDIEGREVTVQP
jgi:transcriptional regulator of acetoin/glycerol metabolism